MEMNGKAEAVRKYLRFTKRPVTADGSSGETQGTIQSSCFRNWPLFYWHTCTTDPFSVLSHEKPAAKAETADCESGSHPSEENARA